MQNRQNRHTETNMQREVDANRQGESDDIQSQPCCVGELTIFSDSSEAASFCSSCAFSVFILSRAVLAESRTDTRTLERQLTFIDT